MFVRSAFYLFWRWFGALCVLLLSDLYGGTNDDANSDGMWFGFLLFMIRSDCHLVWNFLSFALFECVSCKIYFLSLFFCWSVLVLSFFCYECFQSVSTMIIYGFVFWVCEGGALCMWVFEWSFTRWYILNPLCLSFMMDGYIGLLRFICFAVCLLYLWMLGFYVHVLDFEVW